MGFALHEIQRFMLWAIGVPIYPVDSSKKQNTIVVGVSNLWRCVVKSNAKRRPPEIVVREGKPRAVILDIEEYQEILERLEDAEDLKRLEKMRKGKLRSKRLEDFLKEYTPGA